MAKRISRTDQAVECLQKHIGEWLSRGDIAQWIFDNYREQSLAKLERSEGIHTHADLITQMSAEIKPAVLISKDNRIEIRDNPQRFSYSPITLEDVLGNMKTGTTPPSPPSAQSKATDTKESKPEPKPLNEYDLYQKLSDYLFSEDPKIYTKRIDERRSKNKRGAGGNKWLYPDVVGVEVLSQGWMRDIKECVKVYADKKTKLWSFEVKLKINSSNVRESFFQAVSNSSWANFGYLVASHIQKETMSELRILSSLHGIGFIHLNANRLSESQILIPAKERVEVDWNTANRLAEENTDFNEYIQHIRDFYLTDNWKPKDWDGKKLDS